MPKRQVFFSFHYNNDVMRVQQIRNMGVIEGNEPVSPNEWETVKNKGFEAVVKWVDANMKNKSCVVVLVGSDTSNRNWVNYEIQKAWNDKKGLLGIYIHNLKDPRTSNNPPFYGICPQGANPFDKFTLNKNLLSSVIKCYNPKSDDAYNDIFVNLDKWVEEAIKIRNEIR